MVACPRNQRFHHFFVAAPCAGNSAFCVPHEGRGISVRQVKERREIAAQFDTHVATPLAGIHDDSVDQRSECLDRAADTTGSRSASSSRSTFRR